MATLTAKDYVARYINQNDADRMKTVEEAQENLSGTQMKLFRKSIKKIEDEEKEEAMTDNDTKDTPATSTVKGKEPEGTKNEVSKDVSESDALMFWNEIDSMSGDELLSEQVVLDFSYVGFDPNTILKSIISRGRAAKRSKDEIKSDIADMCSIAAVKGSITENNLKKMSDGGKRFYEKIEARYGLKKGGSKGVAPDVITIARVGAAFPGSMMKILMKKSDLAKKFSGPFGSKILPSYLRHQSSAACIPESLGQNAKDFLLGIITAFTSDQSKVISRDKKRTPLEIYENQENFINQTHSSNYPSEKVRKSIFSSWTLIADFEKLNMVAANVIKVNKSFTLISSEDLQTAISAV
jgi:hypothetical protein